MLFVVHLIAYEVPAKRETPGEIRFLVEIRENRVRTKSRMECTAGVPHASANRSVATALRTANKVNKWIRNFLLRICVARARAVAADNRVFSLSLRSLEKADQ